MISKASIQHAETLSNLGAETFYNTHRDSAPAHELAAYMKKEFSLDAVKNAVAHTANIYHVIKYKNKVAGFSKMELNVKHPAIKMEKASKLDQIYLRQPFQGLKLGATLLNYTIEYSKSYGQNGMWLVVWAGNAGAIQFYRKYNFCIAAESSFALSATHSNPVYVMYLAYQ